MKFKIDKEEFWAKSTVPLTKGDVDRLPDFIELEGEPVEEKPLEEHGNGGVCDNRYCKICRNVSKPAKIEKLVVDDLWEQYGWLTKLLPKINEIIDHLNNI